MKKKRFSKKILPIVMSLIAVITTVSIVLVVYAENSASQQATTLTEDQVDKILQDIKSGGDIEAIIKQMDELINRALLTNNTDLQNYAEYVKQACQLQIQLNTVNASISALAQKNSDIAKINGEVEKNVSSSVTSEDVSKVVSESCMEILADVDIAKITEGLDDVPNMEAVLNDPSSATDEQKSLVEAVLLQSAIDKELIEDEDVTKANACISQNVAKLVSAESGKYSSSEYEALKATSKEFAQKGNKATAMNPSQVVMYNEGTKLTVAPIMYDKSILIAIDDIVRFTGASVQYTDGTANIAISTNKKLVEITKGKNTAYVNDQAKSTMAPVITFKGVTYIPIEFFAQAFDVSYVSLPEDGVFITYANLLQANK